MELIISLPGESELVDNDQLGELPGDFVEEMSELGEKPTFKSINIGPGADWIAVLVVFSGLFFLGEKIEKNLSAWLKLGNKLRKLFDKHPKKWVFVDEHGATALCLEDLLENEKQLTKVDQILSNEIKLLDIHDSSLRYSYDYVRMNPYSVYNKAFQINDTKIYIYVVLSSGKIKTRTVIDSYYMDALTK